MMHTSVVKVDAGLNKYCWHKGVRNVPYRVRVKLVRKRAEGDGAKGDKMECVVTLVDTNPKDFAKKLTEAIELEAEADEAE